GLIHAAVDIEQVGIVLPPQHVRVLVYARKVVEQQAIGKPVQLIAKHAEAVAEYFAALGEELGAREDARAPGRRLLGNALRIERAKGLRQLMAVGAGR